MNELQEKASAYDKNPELISRYRLGDEEAGERLVEINLPLVYSIAARFRERCDDVGDLIECGTLGLVKAMIFRVGAHFLPMPYRLFSVKYAVSCVMTESSRYRVKKNE